MRASRSGSRQTVSVFHGYLRGEGFLERSDLKKVGLKVTVPRLKILEILDSGERKHMSAEDIYRALIDDGDDIGLATVYRVLTQFEQAGLVHRHRFEEGRSVFELEVSGHHDHLVCTDCGRVEEFYDEEIEKRQRTVAADLGFEIADHSLNLFVKCIKPACPHRKG
jgi:Fur family transcriptional regulator, ferric uptake regulator